MRRTLHTQMVLAELTLGEDYGLRLAERTGLGRSTVYSILDRLETRGLVRSRRADDETHPGRPRHYWELTGEGARVAADARTWLASRGIRTVGGPEAMPNG